MSGGETGMPGATEARPQGRIAVMCTDMQGRGVQRVCLNLAEEFARQGWAVDLVLLRAEGSFLAGIPPTVRLVDLSVPRAVRAIPALVGYLRRVRPTAVIAAEDSVNVAVLLARALARSGCPVLVSSHVPPRLWASARTIRNKNYWLRIAARLTYPAATARVCLTAGMADEMAALVGLRRDTISVIPNPVVTQRFLGLAAAPTPHPWLAPGAPPVVLGVGSLTRIKGFDCLLHAFARLRKAQPARLILLGRGPEEEALRALAQTLGIAGDVLLAGFQDNPAAWMARAALFVLSSRHEGFGNVLAEAMACGCPVVATACSAGPADILEQGRHGPLVPVDDVEALAEAMARRLQAPRAADDLRRRAERYRVERIAGEYLRAVGLRPAAQPAAGAPG